MDCAEQIFTGTMFQTSTPAAMNALSLNGYEKTAYSASPSQSTRYLGVMTNTYLGPSTIVQYIILVYSISTLTDLKRN